MARSLACRAERGFTILEVVISLAILSTLSATAMLSFSPGTDAAMVTADARNLASWMEQSRTRALLSRKPIKIEMDIEAGVLRIVGGDAPSRHFRSSGFPLDNAETGQAEPGIVFYPDGSASGGGLRLEHNGRRATIQVDALTGRVRLSESVHGRP
jgi:general secretion pathway protein H